MAAVKRVNISISDEVYEALRKLAFEERIQVGTLVKRVVEAWAWKKATP